MDNNQLFIYIFQPFAHYRNPFTWNHPRTFPLPPRSTIVGMLQRLVKDYYGVRYAKEWQNLDIAIMGRSTAKINNYTRLYKGSKFGINKFGQRLSYDREGWKVINGPPGLRANPSPQLVEELFNVRLLILIRGNPNLIGEIEEALDGGDYPNLYLGRAEDIAFVRGYGHLEHLREESLWPYTPTLNYGMWVCSNNLPSTVRGFAFYAPLHSKFKFRDGTVPRDRSELFFKRKDLIRNVVWSKLFYIPEYSEVSLNDLNVSIFRLNPKKGDLSDLYEYMGTSEFRIPNISWLSGGVNSNE